MRTFPPQIVYGPANNGQALLAKSGTYVTVYRDAALTDVEDNLTLSDGSPVADGRVVVDATSRTPRLRLEDDVFVQPLYAKPDGSTLATPIFADPEEAARATAVQPTDVKMSNYTAKIGELVLVDATAGAVTIIAPAGRLAGDRFAVKKLDKTTHPVNVARPGYTIDRDPSLSIISAGGSATMIYDGSTGYYVNEAHQGSPTVPDAPIIGVATAGTGSAQVTFTPPANTGGSPITSYTAVSTPGGITATGSTSPLTVLGLTNGQAYTFKVKATSQVGDGDLSAASNAVTPVANINNPTDISNLSGWYDASQITGVANGGTVQTWADLSGAGHPLTQATAGLRPKWYSSAPPAGVNPNGKPVVYFGQGGGLTYLDSPAFGDPADATIFVVLQTTSPDVNVVYDKAAVGTGRLTADWQSPSIHEGFAGASITGTITQPLAPAIITYKYDQANSSLRRDGTQLAQVNAGANSLGSLRVGADQNAGSASNLRGSIAELIVYSRALTNSEIGQVEGYLRTKYATP